MSLPSFEAMQAFLRRHGIVLGVGLVAFIIQILTLRDATVLGEPFFIASNLVKGLGYSYPKLGQQLPVVTCYIPPLYVWICAFFLRVGGGMLTIQIFNLIALQLSAFVLYRFAHHIVTHRLAIICFIGVSSYIPLWVLASAIEPNSLNLLLLALTVEVVYLLATKPTTRRWIYFGLLTGLQLLVRPDMMVGAVFFGLWLLVLGWKQKQLRMVVPKLALSAGISLLCVLPWTIRNYVEFHTFVLVCANGGYNLWIGNNSSASGEFNPVAWTAESTKQLSDIQEYARDHSVAEYDKLFESDAIAWMLAHPAQLIALDAKKIYFHWWQRSDMGGWYRMDDLQVYFTISSALLLLFGFYGLFQLKNGTARSLILTLFIYSTAIAAIFFVQSRHRVLKVDSFLILLSVAGAYQLVWGRKRSGALAIATIHHAERVPAKEMHVHSEEVTV